MTSKWHAKVLVLKLRQRVDMTPKWQLRGPCHQIKDASKQTDVTSKRHAKSLILKVWKRANMTPKDQARGLVFILKMQANKQTWLRNGMQWRTSSN